MNSNHIFIINGIDEVKNSTNLVIKFVNIAGSNEELIWQFCYIFRYNEK